MLDADNDDGEQLLLATTTTPTTELKNATKPEFVSIHISRRGRPKFQYRDYTRCTISEPVGPIAELLRVVELQTTNPIDEFLRVIELLTENQ